MGLELDPRAPERDIVSLSCVLVSLCLASPVTDELSPWRGEEGHQQPQFHFLFLLVPLTQMEKSQKRLHLSQPGHFLTLGPFSVARGMGHCGLPETMAEGLGTGVGKMNDSVGGEIHSSTWAKTTVTSEVFCYLE